MDPFLSDWQANRPSDESLQMDLVAELQDGTFEPQTRARSNTWPLPRPENFVEPTDDTESTKASNQQLSTDGQSTPQQNTNSSKKNSSRRNAWGNLSYADLITHAIGSATDKRLTLSQIYEWMVHNVPYFKDKGDSNSSAGWKNSIRHNLSLHNRFMRVQNEGTGKSSWWMLNPDAKPGKSVRRRAASMETSKYEKRRGRAKKHVDALRKSGITGINDATPSPSSSVSEGLDHFPESPLHSFQLSPDFRQRASSNASSCGRLSPIPAAVGLEPDWGYTPTGDYQNSSLTPGLANTLDQLAGSLADDLTLQKELFQQGFSTASGIPNQPPPPYQPPQSMYQPTHATVAQSYAMQQSQCPIHRSLPCTCMHNSREGLSPSSGTGMSPSYPHSEPSSDSLNTYTPIDSRQQLCSRLDEEYNQNNAASTLIGQCMEALNNQTQLDDFNIESLHGGLECNIEELIQQELSIDGVLDIAIPLASSNNQNLLCTNSNQTTNSQNTMLLNNTNVTTTTTTSSSMGNNMTNSILTNNTNLGQIDLHQQHQQQQLNQIPTTITTSANNSLPSTKVQLTQTNNVNGPPSWVH